MLAILAAVATVAAAQAALPREPLSAVRTDPKACKAHGAMEVSDPALLYRDDGSAKFMRLAQLPKANHELAVMRMVGPCADPVVVRYGAGR